MSENITNQLLEESAYKFVLKAKDHFENQRKQAGYHRVWQKCEESYFSGTKDFYQGIARVCIPFLHNKVETITPKVDKAIFPNSGNWFESVPDNIYDSVQVEQALSAETLLKDQCRDVGIRTKYQGMIRNLCIYGTVWAKTYWEHRTKQCFGRDDAGNRIEKFIVDYDNPNTYSPSIWDIWADIKDEDLTGLVIEKSIRDYSELWELRERIVDGALTGVYQNVEKLKEVQDKKEDLPTESDREKSDATQGLNNHEFGAHEHKIVILECWGKIPKWFITKNVQDKKDKLVTEGMIVIALSGNEASPTVLRIADNPFDHQEKPYQRARYLRIDGRLYGIGLMEPNIPMEAELNTLRNQTMDNRTFNLRPKWLRDNSSKISDAALKDESMQIIDTQDMGGLEPLRPNDMTASALASEQAIKADLSQNTEGSPIISGVAGGNSIERTSVGVSTLASAALDRFDLVVTNFTQEMIVPQLKQFWSLNQQFLPMGRELKVLGTAMVRVLPQDIPFPNINFVGIQQNAQKEFRINALNILIQNVSTLAPMGLDPIPLVLEQVRLLGEEQLIVQIDKRPTSDEILEQTPEGEIRLLMLGRRVKIDMNDDHEKYIPAYDQLLANQDIPDVVRRNAESAKGQRIVAMQIKNDPSIFTNILNSRKEIGK